MSKSPRYWTFSRVLLRDTFFKGYLVNKAPLRVGSGRVDRLGSPVDIPTLYVNYAGINLTYIPGSSLKGLFRSCAETLATAKGLDVCDGLPKSTCMDLRRYSTQEDGELNLSTYVERKIRRGELDNAMKAFWNRACLMCKVFGSPSYSGKVIFFDAYPLDDKNEPTPHTAGTRTGISIDRRMGAVFQQALFTAEYVEPGAKFRFSVRCQNLPNYALGLLSYVIELIDSGCVKVGGFKSRGFGIVKFEGLTFTCRDYGVEGVRGPILRSFREFNDEADGEVDLSGVASLEDGWIVSKGDAVWEVLAKLRGLWEGAKVKS